MPIKVICPECGPQEHRGYQHPWRKAEAEARYVNRLDHSCPKCCTETLPLSAAESMLALWVRTAATSYFEKEQGALDDRLDRMQGVPDRRGIRLVVG